jgi:hypothetical protein
VRQEADDEVAVFVSQGVHGVIGCVQARAGRA